MIGAPQSGRRPDLTARQRGRDGLSSAAGALQWPQRVPAAADTSRSLDTGGSGPRPAYSLLHADDVADMLGVSKPWVYAEVRAGRMPHVRLGRYIRFRRESIECWLREIETGRAR
ncbi:MAG: helix-turn-helix domain-containing protein [Solirubrobacteraceae bacterium]